MQDATNHEADNGEDKSDSGYRDDPSELAASSDYAQGGTTGEYAGGGPGDAPHDRAGRHGAGNNAGSQEDWRGTKDGDAPQASAEQAADSQVDPEKSVDQKGEPVVSRSEDPGQGSYGGFKGEGPADSEPVDDSE